MSAPIDYRHRGQAVWLDSISSKMIHSGRLSSLIEAGSIYGVTSNPTIFGQAIVKNEGDYNAGIERLARDGKDAFAIYDALTRKDIAEGADAFRALHEKNPVDGWISLEVLPSLAGDTEKTVAEAKRLSCALARPNVFIKVPATLRGRPRDPPPDRRGDLDQRHAHVQPQALPRRRERLPRRPFGLRGEGRRPLARPLGRLVLRLARRHAHRQAPRREDPEGGRAGEGPPRGPARQGRPRELEGRLRGLSRRLRAPRRSRALRAKGARVQRPLWASTGTKNPAYSDLLYVENLIGPDTVNTMPEKTLEALLDHGRTPGDTVMEGVRRGAPDARRPSGRRHRRRGGRRAAPKRRRRPVREVLRRAPRDDRDAPRRGREDVRGGEGVILGNFDGRRAARTRRSRGSRRSASRRARRHPEDDDARRLGPPRRLDVVDRLRARPLGLRELRPEEPVRGGSRPGRDQPRPHVAGRLRGARAPRVVRPLASARSGSGAAARRSRDTWRGTCPGSTGARATSGRASRRPSASRWRRRSRETARRSSARWGTASSRRASSSEARRYAVKFALTNLVALLDWNRVQLSGTQRRHPQAGHRRGLEGGRLGRHRGRRPRRPRRLPRRARGARAAVPTLVACRTVMSKGVPFMEKDGYKWHGAALPLDKCKEALAILGAPDDLDHWIAERKKPAPDWHAVLPHRPVESVVLPSPGTPRTYTTEKTPTTGAPSAPRSRISALLGGGAPPAASRWPSSTATSSKSTKTDLFAAKYPKSFFQGGIAEHHTAVARGRAVCRRSRGLVGRVRDVRRRRGLQPAAPERRQRDEREARRDALGHRRGRGRQDAPFDRLLRPPELDVRLEGLHAGRSEPDRPHHALDGDAPRATTRSSWGARSSRSP